MSGAEAGNTGDTEEPQFDSNAIWIVKNAHDLAAGGLMYLKKTNEGPMYALQHMATGGYLAGNNSTGPARLVILEYLPRIHEHKQRAKREQSHLLLDEH
jgi:hypothetical protein